MTTLITAAKKTMWTGTKKAQAGERFQNNDWIHWFRVNGRPIGVKRYTISGFVWTWAIRSNSCILQLQAGKLLFGGHSSKSLQ